MRILERQDADTRRSLEARYADIWAEFGPSLSRLVASYEARIPAQEDLLQDIRLAIWMSLPKFRGEASTRTFVFRIAHNRGLTHVWRRRNAVQPETLDDVEAIDPLSDPEQAMISRQYQERMHTAIRSLPIPLMQVLTLALEDVSHREIAEILGISENNVAVRLTRARGLLRQKLGGSE